MMVVFSGSVASRNPTRGFREIAVVGRAEDAFEQGEVQSREREVFQALLK
jgi:hypothetical protein